MTYTHCRKLVRTNKRTNPRIKRRPPSTRLQINRDRDSIEKISISAAGVSQSICLSCMRKSLSTTGKSTAAVNSWLIWLAATENLLAR